MPHDRKKAAEAREFVRELLRTEWNPIGVPDLPDDEYEGHAMKALGIIVKGGSVTQVIESLWWAETEHMCLPGDKARTEAVGRKLDEGVRRILQISPPS